MTLAMGVDYMMSLQLLCQERMSGHTGLQHAAGQVTYCCTIFLRAELC